ncbi:MAG TPA: dihydroneopterin aldolase [Oscillatoriales cyanobacterium M59_W2019_021]|nr:dihydroneopterin aldolase [Oscillatoriales cyanobacterium M4454_W2019_049]HIK49310.1 dihydroneopterin aldolase [Oscillatoriales cyanobacterium M59_W2019_021]
MDSIRVTGIRGYGYTGYLPEEQVLGQWFEVDLTLETDLAAAGKSDRLEDTLDYRSVISAVDRIIKTAKFVTIERMAQAIADEILADDRVRQVRIQLTKPAPPIPDFGGKVTVDIVRSRVNT